MATKAQLTIPNNGAVFAALTAVNEQIEACEKEHVRLTNLRIETIKSFVILCTACAKHAKIFEWTFIQDHWYEGPYGCTGGAEWHESSTDSCHITCPDCYVKHYIYMHPQKKDIVSLVKSIKPFGATYLFKKVENAYDR